MRNGNHSFAGVAQRRERLACPPGGAGSVPAPRSMHDTVGRSIELGFHNAPRPRAEPLVLAIATVAAIVGVAVIFLAGYATAIVVRGLSW